MIVNAKSFSIEECSAQGRLGVRTGRTQSPVWEKETWKLKDILSSQGFRDVLTEESDEQEEGDI